jgi:hypothetical protein
MISYDLCCSAAHGFEGWFASFSDFEAQLKNGLLVCPICNDADITKLLTAPNLGRKSNQSGYAAPQIRGAEPAIEPALAPPETSSDALSIAHTPDMVTEVIERLAKVQSEILKESRWVGRKFADEARAMHYGEVPPQPIHGETSAKEAQALSDEGVAIAALPLPFIPPEAKN